MKQELKDCLNKLTSKLRSEIDPDHGLLAQLLEKEVLTEEQIDTCKVKGTKSEKVDDILTLLKRQPDDCFLKFCDALEAISRKDLSNELKQAVITMERNAVLPAHDSPSDGHARHQPSTATSAPGNMANAELKAKFTELHKMVVDQNLSSVVDDLFQEKILSDANMRDLHNEKNRKQQAQKLLAILHTSHNTQAFIKLREAINREPACSFIIERLDALGIDDSVGDSWSTKVPRVVHTLPEAESVGGVTSLDDELYVQRSKATDCVEVYNTTTTLYSLLRHLSVPGLKSVSDMTSCKHYRCLYICDDISNCVHRVELNGKVTKWSVNYRLSRLSVTSQFTVIVTCHIDSKLLELTTEGKQLREINLQSDIVNPWHAIQLSNGQFVVCHGWSNDPVNRVCIVDTNGHVTQSYGGPRGSATVGQLNTPAHLAVDKDEFIFVVDCNNRRVLLLSPTLSFVREIVSRDQLNWYPWRLFLDVDRRRLYVAENENEVKDEEWITGRVVVVQL